MNGPSENTEAPVPPKRKMNLRIYKPFEDAADAEAIEAARKPPLEGLRDTVELILRVYGVTRRQLIERRQKMHINIIRRQ